MLYKCNKENKMFVHLNLRTSGNMIGNDIRDSVRICVISCTQLYQALTTRIEQTTNRTGIPLPLRFQAVCIANVLPRCCSYFVCTTLNFCQGTEKLFFSRYHHYCSSRTKQAFVLSNIFSSLLYFKNNSFSLVLPT